jgi:hypothetical protein
MIHYDDPMGCGLHEGIKSVLEFGKMYQVCKN